MNSRGRPRLYGGQPARRVHISLPGELAAEADAAPKLNVSEICAAAIRKELADKVYIDAAKEVINAAIFQMEKKFEAASMLGPEERLAFHKIRSVVWAIEGDAWIKRAKLAEIRATVMLPNNGDGKLVVKPINGGEDNERIPISERK